MGQGRTDNAIRLEDLLAFQAAHARARDAVHAVLDTQAIAASVAPHKSILVRSQAPDRAIYLARPDLGRRLDPECRPHLEPGAWDVVFIAADGLSAIAVQQQAAGLFAAASALLPGWRIAPLVMATEERVALGDEIGALLGALLGAAMSVVMIGERPGLSVAGSLGLYITHAPRPGRADAERNCISNIHGGDTDDDGAGGLGISEAAHRLAWLLREARRLGLTGIGLKDASPALERTASPRIDGTP